MEMSSNLRPYDRVRVLSSRFAAEGVSTGAIGFILEGPRNNWFLVEVSRPDGTTIALISAEQNQLEKVDRESVGPLPQLSSEDLRKLGRLQQNASGPSRLYRFNHRLHFPTEEAANHAADSLRLVKYAVELQPPTRGEGWHVVASHKCIPDQEILAETIAEIQKLAVTFAGRYDGWTAQVIEGGNGRGRGRQAPA